MFSAVYQPIFWVYQPIVHIFSSNFENLHSFIHNPRHNILALKCTNASVTPKELANSDTAPAEFCHARRNCFCGISKHAANALAWYSKALKGVCSHSASRQNVGPFVKRKKSCADSLFPQC